MQLDKIVLGKKHYVVKHTLNEDPGNPNQVGDKHTIVCHEAPLPELPKAFKALRGVVAVLHDIPEEFRADYAKTTEVTTLTITRTSAGTRTVKLAGTRVFSSRPDHPHPIDTVAVQIDVKGAGESTDRDVDAKTAKKIGDAIAQAEAYMRGERSQQRLDFSDEEEEDEEEAAAREEAEIAKKGPKLF